MVFTRYIAYLENLYFRRGDKMAFRFIRIPVKRLIIPFLPNKMRNNGEGAVDESGRRFLVRSFHPWKETCFCSGNGVARLVSSEIFFSSRSPQLFIRRVSGSAATRPTI